MIEELVNRHHNSDTHRVGVGIMKLDSKDHYPIVFGFDTGSDLRKR